MYRRIVLSLVALAAALIAPGLARADMVTQWNQNAATVLMTNLGQGPQLSVPHLAMVHGAAYDAVNAIDDGHEGYLLTTRIGSPFDSKDAAAATAAYRVLRHIAPDPQDPLIDAMYASRPLRERRDGRIGARPYAPESLLLVVVAEPVRPVPGPVVPAQVRDVDTSTDAVERPGSARQRAPPDAGRKIECAMTGRGFARADVEDDVAVQGGQTSGLGVEDLRADPDRRNVRGCDRAVVPDLALHRRGGAFLRQVERSGLMVGPRSRLSGSGDRKDRGRYHDERGGSHEHTCWGFAHL